MPAPIEQCRLAVRCGSYTPLPVLFGLPLEFAFDQSAHEFRGCCAVMHGTQLELTVGIRIEIEIEVQAYGLRRPCTGLRLHKRGPEVKSATLAGVPLVAGVVGARGGILNLLIYFICSTQLS